eukprot:COSAG02_NODE_21520_length_785_cov_0.858601_2_plen_47_part_01
MRLHANLALLQLLLRLIDLCKRRLSMILDFFLEDRERLQVLETSCCF